MGYITITMNRLFKKIGLSFIAVLLLTVGQTETVNAATLYAQPLSAIGAEDVFVVDVLLDTEGETINTIDGLVKLSSTVPGIEVRDISTAGSVISMWPRSPSLSEKGDTITFTGGVPGGISGKDLQVFKIVISVSKASELQIVSDNIKVYLNDGKGTSVSAKTRFSPINIGVKKAVPVDVWKDAIANDNISPEPFTIKILQDENLYGGSKFISFSTTDKQSGISHYEVKEGMMDAVRTGETYVLIDQTGKSDIIVTAFDNAGNTRSSAVLPKDGPIDWMSVFFGTVIAALILKFKSVIRMVKKYAGRK